MADLKTIINILLVLVPTAASIRVMATLMEMQGDEDNRGIYSKRIKNVIIITIMIEIITSMVGVVEHYYM